MMMPIHGSVDDAHTILGVGDDYQTQPVQEMAAPPNNVELEAAKFLHKLIQESKDEPKKLATKLYVILQHMRSSGKENSMPYQVISRRCPTCMSGIYIFVKSSIMNAKMVEDNRGRATRSFMIIS
ncbi:chromatin structure-remodeling complex protein SYD-like [Rhododendron vialii]|uniref:chromatin structure-remodeling complex protein SYD-like n=1 Tax=Rhododendron vialii TaxID=182163 RepID=UPI00265FA692|nr:chromatin structure-remodeling complex protein SYD-like [Rhododendron vialii]